MRSCISTTLFFVATVAIGSSVANAQSFQAASAQAAGNGREPLTSTYAQTTEYQQPAHELMRVATGMARTGDLRGARSVARTAHRMASTWDAEAVPIDGVTDYFPEYQTSGTAVQPGYPQVSNRNMQPVSPPSVTYPAPHTEKRVQVCGYCQADRHLSPIWVEADYYYWHIRDPSVAPLVTTSTAGTLEENAGVLGLDSTTVLVGDESLLHSERSGLRYAIGYQLEPHFSFSASWTNIIRDTNSRNIDLGDGILARPFENLTDGPDAELITFPGLTDGRVSVNADRDFETYELLFHRDMGFWKNGFIKGSLGYRYAKLDDDLSIREISTATGGALDGTVTNLIDEFDTDNRFHGGTFGLSMHWHPTDRWVVTAGGKVSVGNSKRSVRINGSTTSTDVAGTTTVDRGGLLALDSNIGHHNDNQMTYFTEIGLKARYRMSQGAHFVLGYTFLHWDEIARATDQIDTTVNVTQIPPGTLIGASRPGFSLVKNDFMAHGFRLGIEYAY